MRVVFMGSPDFAVPCLRALEVAHEVVLVVSQPDKPAGRGSQLTAPAVKVAALEIGIAVIQPRSARTGELYEALAATGAELAVVVAYGKILPRVVLDALPRGCINVHASLLPKYRGAAPVQWAVINGELATGVAIMQLDEGMDTGPVLLERRVPIDPEETSGELLARLAPIGATALLEAIAEIAAGSARPRPQDHAAASHAPMLTKADGAIDFTATTTAVAARIRGVDPWPGAQALHRQHVVKLFGARAIEPCTTPTGDSPKGALSSPGHAQSIPGQILAIDGQGMTVATGQGVVMIREIQAPGRKRMTVSQFAAGRGIAVGDVLAKPVIG